jgi:polyisoprenoid-binding protein YceI
MMFRSIHKSVVVAAACGLLAAGAATAQAPRPPASTDPAAAPAGAYKLDPGHTSLIARVGHMNVISFSTFRFGVTSGTLNWDPAKVDASKVDITIDTGSIATPVKGFAEELSGPMFLNVAKFPTAHFVSTSIRRTGPTSGVITGDLTFLGQTKPMQIDAQLVGVGKSMRGASVIGFTGVAKMKRSDYGFTTYIPVIADEVSFVIDTEFDKAS